MAQIYKFQGGGETPQAQNTPQPVSSINNVQPKEYFSVGPTSYELQKFKDIVWRNFDAWMDHYDFNSKVKDYSRKFINEVLEQLTNGDAKFNPDMTLTAKDTESNWDPTNGFNKSGPRLFHWLTSDKVDDQRGIPHVAMRYLVDVLRSPVMQQYKKPEVVELSNLTGKVFEKIVSMNFANWGDFRNNWSKRSNADKIGMFRDALKSFKNSTDFSLFTQESVRDLIPNIDQFITYLDSNPEMDQKFFDKATSLGFYGLESRMGYTPPAPQQSSQTPTPGSSVTDNGSQNNPSVTPTAQSSQQSGGGSRDIGVRILSQSDLQRIIAPTIDQTINTFYDRQLGYVRNQANRGIYGLSTRQVSNMRHLLETANTFQDAVDIYYNGDKGRAIQEISRKSAYINRYLLGLSTGYNDTQLNYLMTVVLNKAGKLGELEPFSNVQGSYYIRSSYDPDTKTYLALNSKTNNVFVIPSIFVASDPFWTNLTNSVNNYLRSDLRGAGSAKTYTKSDIYNIALTNYFKQKRSSGFLYDFLSNLNMSVYPRYKEGGILKALTGSQIYAADDNRSQGQSAQQIRQYREQRRAQVDRKRDVWYQQQQAQKETERQDYLDRQHATITSFDDLARNMDSHDAWVVFTLLSDIVAFGGSLSGGAFNPVTDIATLSSMVGTIGTVSTDKSMSTLEKVGYGTAGVLLDAVSLVPELGALGKAAKIGAIAKRAAPILIGALRYGAIAGTAYGALGPLYKLYNGQDLTKGDWTNLAYFAQAMLMGTLGGRAIRGGKKYTTSVSSRTNYQIRTKGRNGGWVNVDKNTFHRVQGAKVRDVAKGKNKPVFTTTDGQKVYAKDLPSRGPIRGKAEPVNEGFRLKTPQEVSEDLGLNPVTVNGRTYYPVPRDYERVRYRMSTDVNESFRNVVLGNRDSKITVPLINRNGDVVLKLNGEPIMVKVPHSKAKEMSNLYEKKHGVQEQETTVVGNTAEEVTAQAATQPTAGTPESTPATQTPTNPTPASNPTPNPTVVNPTPNPTPNPKPQAPSRDLASRRRTQVDQQTELRSRRERRRELQQSGNSSRRALPTRERTRQYYDRRTKQYVADVISKVKSKHQVGDEQLAMLRRRRNRSTKLQYGGFLPLLAQFSSIPIDYEDDIYYNPNNEQKGDQGQVTNGNNGSVGNGSVGNGTGKKTFKDDLPGRSSWLTDLVRGIGKYTRPHHVLAAAEAALAVKTAKKSQEYKDQAATPALDQYNTSIDYSPTLAVQNEFNLNQMMGKNNTNAARATSSDIRAYYGNLYANNLTNSALANNYQTEKANEFKTNQTNINNAVNQLRAAQLTTANANNQKVQAARAARLNNADEYNTVKNQAIATYLNMHQEEEASRDKARNILGQYALKSFYEGYSNELRDLNAAKEAYAAKKQAFIKSKTVDAPSGEEMTEQQANAAWMSSNERKEALADVKKYETVFNINWYKLLMNGTDPGFHEYFLEQLNELVRGFDFQDVEEFNNNFSQIVDPEGEHKKNGGKLKQGGSLSYEQRMSLKQQDAMNKMITTDKRERESVKRELIREHNKNMRLISKRSEMLLKAALGIK